MKNLNCNAVKIGGSTNYLPIINTFTRKIAIGKLIRAIIKELSQWIRNKNMRLIMLSDMFEIYMTNIIEPLQGSNL